MSDRSGPAARASAWGFESLRLRCSHFFKPRAASRPLLGFLHMWLGGISDGPARGLLDE